MGRKKREKKKKIKIGIEKNLLNNIPNITGTVTIKNISRDMLIREIS